MTQRSTLERPTVKRAGVLIGSFHREAFSRKMARAILGLAPGEHNRPMPATLKNALTGGLAVGLGLDGVSGKRVREDRPQALEAVG